MGRRDYPNAEKIAKRARKLQGAASAQAKLDTDTIAQYTQAHIIEARHRDAKAIGFGMVGNMVDKRVNIVAQRPYARVLGIGGIDAERHASGKLEPWANTAPWIAERGYDVWDTGLQDDQMIGRAWSKVLPQFHKGAEYRELADKRKRKVEAGEDLAEIKEKMRVYRRDHFPIAWVYVDPVSVFADPDEEGPLAEVYEFRKLSRGTIEERFPGVTLKENQEEFGVIEYANDVWVATIYPEGGGIFGVLRSPGGFLGEPWEHGIGINPYVRIVRGPLRGNSQGYEYTGCSFQVREMSDSLDESATDWRTGMHREAKSPIVTTLVPQIRQNLNIDDKKIEPDDKGNIILYADKERGVETVARAPVPTVNEQLGQYIGMVGAQADRTGAFVPELTGQGPSGESAVHASAVRQSALTGELEMPVRHLEEGYAQVVDRHFRCVEALDKKLSKDADEDMRKVVVCAEDSKNKAREIAVTAKDVRNHGKKVRGRIQKNLPINVGLNVQNLLQLTDRDNPKLTDATALEMFLNKEDPQEEEDKLFQQRLRRAGDDAYVESYAQRVKLIADEFSDEELAKLAQKMLMAPEAVQAAIMSRMGQEDGNRLAGQMDRTAANTRGTGVPQGLSQLQGMNTEMPVG